VFIVVTAIVVVIHKRWTRDLSRAILGLATRSCLNWVETWLDTKNLGDLRLVQMLTSFTVWRPIFAWMCGNNVACL